jgi:diguanylate cyclase (GGDEF)-like protein
MNWISPFSLAPSDRPHARAVQMALVRELYRRSRVPVLTQLVSIGVFYILLRDQVAALPWLWFLGPAVLVVTGARAVLAFQGERLEEALRRPTPRFFLFTALASALGFLAGAMVLVVLPHLDPGRFLLLTLCVMGLASLGCITMAGSPVCYAATLLPLLGSLVLAGLLHPPYGMGYLFSLAVLVYIAALLGTSLQVHHSFFHTVVLTRRLEDMALRDPLTGLRNRRFLQEFMQEETPRVLRRWLLQDGEIVNRRSISLILVDLDFFKHVNDEYGHAAGDAVLLQVARLLKEIVRKPDLVVRWGGEEFVILALDSDRTAPPLIAVRVHEQMANHGFVLPGGQVIRLTCSVGYALYPFHPGRPERLGWEQVFRLADQGLYGAKGDGRNRLCGVLPGAGDPDTIIDALDQPDPDFAQAVEDGLVTIG